MNRRSKDEPSSARPSRAVKPDPTKGNRVKGNRGKVKPGKDKPEKGKPDQVEPVPADPAQSHPAQSHPAQAAGTSEPRRLTKQDFEDLARFRFGIRRYLRFSEETVKSHGLTPRHYQLMLALKGFPGRDWATVGELAEQLQLRHHSVVELVDRAQRNGLVARTTHSGDGRTVRVILTTEGERMLDRLSALHRDELRRMDAGLLAAPVWGDAAAAAEAHRS